MSWPRPLAHSLTHSVSHFSSLSALWFLQLETRNLSLVFEALSGAPFLAFSFFFFNLKFSVYNLLLFLVSLEIRGRTWLFTYYHFVLCNFFFSFSEFIYFVSLKVVDSSHQRECVAARDLWVLGEV